MSLRTKWHRFAEPTPEETDLLLGYARRLSGAEPHPLASEKSRALDMERYRLWLDKGTWFSSASCFEGGTTGPDGWYEHNRQRIALWRDSHDKTSPEQVAFHAWARRSDHATSAAEDLEIPTQTWATLTWAQVRALLRANERAAAEPEQLSIFDLIGAAA